MIPPSACRPCPQHDRPSLAARPETSAGSYTTHRDTTQDTFAHACGLRVRPHIHFDGIVPGIDPRWLATNLKTLETKLVQYFGPGSADLT